MKAVLIKEFGTPDVLEIADLAEPAHPSGNEVVVRVHAAGLNRADLLQVAGKYPPPAGYDPKRPGMEFAGEVAAIGDAVKEWKTGDRVFGITAGEAQGEFLKVDASLLAPIPENLSFTDAAGVPEVFITAHDAVFTRGELKSGEALLVHAVGSGVGLAALQIAKAAGATVIGTSRTPYKLERSREYGLDHGIITTGSDFAEAVVALTNSKGANVILDLVGAAYFEQNLQALALKGRLILVGLTSGREANFNLGLALQKRATVIGTTLRGRSVAEKAEATRKFVADVVPHFSSGRIRPNIDRVFAAENVVEAYEYLASNESFGKVVIEF
jgi:NADPH2:quinone reductase